MQHAYVYIYIYIFFGATENRIYYLPGLVKIDLAGIHSFIFVRTLKPEWFKCSAKDHGPTLMVLAVLAVLAATVEGKDGGSIPSLAVLALLAVAKNIEIVRSFCQI